MRLWLVDDRLGADSGFRQALRELQQRPKDSVQLVGEGPYQADFVDVMREYVPDLLDLIVVNERVWPDASEIREIMKLGFGIVINTAPGRLGRFRSLAESHAINFVPPDPGVDALWLTLVNALAAHRRETQWRIHADRLQRRLEDRIIIERAKGILVHRLKISEEDAYLRLRALSRRQRRQIRDIAQSLLDTQCLFSSEVNGFARQGSESLALELEKDWPGS